MKQLPELSELSQRKGYGYECAILESLYNTQEAVVPVPDRLAVEGKVVQRAECRPISNNVYLSIKKVSCLFTFIAFCLFFDIMFTFAFIYVFTF